MKLFYLQTTFSAHGLPDYTVESAGYRDRNHVVCLLNDTLVQNMQGSYAHSTILEKRASLWAWLWAG